MLSCVTSCKQFRAQFRLFQVKNHVEACESHDFNMDFCSFDNGSKQLHVMYSMQEYGDQT